MMTRNELIRIVAATAIGSSVISGLVVYGFSGGGKTVERIIERPVYVDRPMAPVQAPVVQRGTSDFEEAKRSFEQGPLYKRLYGEAGQKGIEIEPGTQGYDARCPFVGFVYSPVAKNCVAK